MTAPTADPDQWRKCLAILHALIKSATPLPWYAPPRGDRNWLYEDGMLTSGPKGLGGGGSSTDRVLARMNTNFPYRDDLELIVAAVNTLPDFLAFAEHQLALIDELKAAVKVASAMNTVEGALWLGYLAGWREAVDGNEWELLDEGQKERLIAKFRAWLERNAGREVAGS